MVRALVALCALLVWPSPSHALRCGTRLVDVGDTREQVRALCGEPTDVSVRVETRSVHVRVAGGIVTQAASVLVETWTLNFGPQRFMKRLTFQDGVVTDIETLGRGYRPEQLGMSGRHLHLGESRDRVRATWGEPTSVTVRVETRAVTTGTRRVLATDEVEVEVETWVYDFGPQRFPRRLTFEDGRLVQLETLSR